MSTNGNMFVVKTYFESDVRRFLLPALDFIELDNAIVHAYETKNYKVEYVDDEKDRITVSSTLELVEAFSSVGNGPLKLYVTRTEAEDSAAVPGAEVVEEVEVEQKESDDDELDFDEASKHTTQDDDTASVGFSDDDMPDANDFVPSPGQVLSALNSLVSDPTSLAALQTGIQQILDMSELNAAAAKEGEVEVETEPLVVSGFIDDVIAAAKLPDGNKKILQIFSGHFVFKLDHLARHLQRFDKRQPRQASLLAAVGGHMVYRDPMHRGPMRCGRGRGGRRGGARRGPMGCGRGRGRGRGGRGGPCGGQGPRGRPSPRARLMRLKTKLQLLPELMLKHPKLSNCFKHSYGMMLRSCLGLPTGKGLKAPRGPRPFARVEFRRALLRRRGGLRPGRPFARAAFRRALHGGRGVLRRGRGMMRGPGGRGRGMMRGPGGRGRGRGPMGGGPGGRGRGRGPMGGPRGPGGRGRGRGPMGGPRGPGGRGRGMMRGPGGRGRGPMGGPRGPGGRGRGMMRGPGGRGRGRGRGRGPMGGPRGGPRGPMGGPMMGPPPAAMMMMAGQGTSPPGMMFGPPPHMMFGMAPPPPHMMFGGHFMAPAASAEDKAAEKEKL